MATYFHGLPPPEIQSDGLQTLYLMNPNFMGCSSDAPAAPNMLLMNSGSLHYWTPTAAASALNQQGLSLSLSQPPPYMTHRPPPPENDVISQAASPPGALVGSKYLKAAREILEEVVSVVSSSIKLERGRAKSDFRTNGEFEGGSGGGGGGGVEISTTERQELQMKKAKLVRMLDEVEQRYRQYHHQMQIITSAFEATTSTGSAKTYTSLALRTISRQFRCLRDAISGQIRATGRRLGEEEVVGESGSRLRFVDHHLRQQRALQRLGMVQHNNTWRPQRGLPEQAVSVLRAWLFEHFLHPYPKDSDKHMLAKQTGLTRSQVSNWFINARVRLWKPMVEEMYLEEIKQEPNTTIDGEAAAKDDSASRSSTTAQSDPPPTSITDPIRYEETMEQFKPKKARIEYLRQAPLPPPPPPFGAYFEAAEQMRFSSNGVSLTLGLHENNPSMAASMQRVSDAYEGLSMQSRERFSAHHQLLPDFVT